MEFDEVSVNDATWVTVTSENNNFNHPIILTALPDIGGSHYRNGTSTATRIRNVVNNAGVVSFEVKLFQPNDTYCSKQWYIPEYLDPVTIGYAITEYGAYNFSNVLFIIGEGLANRTSPTLGVNASYEFHQLDYPTGCGQFFNATCRFPQFYPTNSLGAVATIQSFVHEEYLFLRIQSLARRFLKIVVTPHDSTNAAYFTRFKEPETIGYVAFLSGLAIDCVYGFSVETKRWDSVTSNKLHFPYAYDYVSVSGVFGILLTQNSLVDATSLRAFHRNLTDAFVITQEDQCDEEDPVHTTLESASVMIVGRTLTGCPAPTFAPSTSPTFAPSTSPTINPTVSPTAAPTDAPTNGPTCVYNFLLYDLFGDGWQNINLAVDTDGEITNHQVQCACDMIQVVSQSCLLTIQMTSDGEALAPWEPLWGTIVGGETWVGDFGTIMYIDHDTVTVENGPDVDPNSIGNQCKACTPPSDDDKEGGDDKPSPGSRSRPRPNRRRGCGRDRRDDDKVAGDGKGKANGKADDAYDNANTGGGGDDKNTHGHHGKNKDDTKCADDDDNKKRMLGAGDDGNHTNTGLAPFTIFDQFGNGWYKGEGYSSGVCDSELCPNSDDTCEAETIDLPDILTYPKWYVMNAARTELVDFGSMCENPKGIEGCVISLPDGRYVFRVAGYNVDGDVASWRFCGIYGVNHQELQFSMINGQCVAHALLAAEDYCTGFKTLVVLSGSISITGVTDANIDDYDTNAIYLQLLAMFPNTVAVEIVSQNHEGSILTVDFMVTVSPEDYGLDGSVSSNIDALLNTVYAAAQSESQSSFLSGLSTSILSSPAGAKDALAHVSGATLTSLEVIQVQYVKKDDNTVLHPLDVTSSSSSLKGEMTQNGISIMTVVALVCGAIFMAAATAFALLRNRASTHTPLSDKSSHLDTSVNKVSTGTSLDIEK